ncbi:hypothetical protein FXO38_14518 [Capsicum annuum]|nr:hypothetical protein FXO38_14518 [Capsicum annuum]KAF3674720.1 hypothetical protein FXO37_06260 [Capsicum annuum]
MDENEMSIKSIDRNNELQAIEQILEAEIAGPSKIKRVCQKQIRVLDVETTLLRHNASLNEVTTYEKAHCCSVDFITSDHRNATSKVICDYLLELVRDSRNVDPIDATRFVVREEGVEYIVDLKSRTCQCLGEVLSVGNTTSQIVPDRIKDLIIKPPDKEVLLGRRQTSRYPCRTESSRNNYRCSRCKRIGHNRSNYHYTRLAAREDTYKSDDDKEWFHFLISSAGLCFVTSFNLQNKNMPPKRRNGNQSASQPEEPLGEHVSHAEFRAACTTLAQSITSQNKRPAIVLANLVANSAVTKIQDFTRMNPPFFLRFKSDEDPQEFIDQKEETVLSFILNRQFQLLHQLVLQLLSSGMVIKIGRQTHSPRVVSAMPELIPFVRLVGATSSATSGKRPNRLDSLQSQQDQENSPDVVTVKDTSSKTPNLDLVPVVNEYSDVFPKDLPGIPPKRKINFDIDLLPDTQPISILPFRMAPAKLRKLKEQLKDLLDKGLIGPNVSP